jgi:DNA-binding beta-propeller fold protein YncE
VARRLGSVTEGRLKALCPALTYSSPIAVTSDDQFVWVANPQNNLSPFTGWRAT